MPGTLRLTGPGVNAVGGGAKRGSATLRGNSQGQIWHQIEEGEGQLVVAHHGVVNFIKALFGYLEPPGVNPKNKIASEYKRQEPHHQHPHVDCRAPT